MSLAKLTTISSTKVLWLLGLVVLFGIGWHYQSAREDNTTMLVQNPKINDFYFIDYFRFDPNSHPIYRYTLLRAVEVDNQSVTLQRGNISQRQKGGARSQLKGDRAMLEGFFSKDTITLSRRELVTLVQSDIIYDVRRAENLTIDGWLVARPSQPKGYVHQVNQDNQQGIAYYRGEDGYDRDYKNAFDAFKKAAQANDPAGQLNLAEMYRDGMGTNKDTEQALYWFEQAASQGYGDAKWQYKKPNETKASKN